PLDSIANAISASNTYIAIAANANKRNTIYVGGGMYSETLTTLPNQCDIIGVGCRTSWPTLIEGITTIGSIVVGCHIYNMHFHQVGTALPTISIPTGSHGTWFTDCVISMGTSATIGLSFAGTCNTCKVIGCQFDGDAVFPIGINFTSCGNFNRIEDNYINATTTGINISDGSGDSDWGTLIKNNVICHCAVGNSTQLTTGISFLDASGTQAMVIGNYISATDAISWASGTLTGDRERWMCLANRVGEGGSGSWE
ncbi:unnamed protein product, partial [marine sediment metagenome]